MWTITLFWCFVAVMLLCIGGGCMQLILAVREEEKWDRGK